MSLVYALALAVVGSLFVYYANEEGLRLTQLGTSAYYLTVAFIAFVNAALFAAASFVQE
jgi:hypothetical protein